MSRCIAVVTDIWRTESGRSQRFTEPLVSLGCGDHPAAGDGLPEAREITGDPWVGAGAYLTESGDGRNILILVKPGHRHESRLSHATLPWVMSARGGRQRELLPAGMRTGRFQPASA